jgi:hypothetical protein
MIVMVTGITPLNAAALTVMTPIARAIPEQLKCAMQPERMRTATPIILATKMRTRMGLLQAFAETRPVSWLILATPSTPTLGRPKATTATMVGEGSIPLRRRFVMVPTMIVTGESMRE